MSDEPVPTEETPETTETEEIGDMEPDDAHDPDDGAVDWTNVEQLASQVESINAIEDEDEKTEAAKAWAAELGGGG